MNDVIFGILWGLGAVVVLWLTWKFLSRATDERKRLTIKNLVTGEDNRFSVSKLQATSWFFAVFFGYVATYAVRVRYGDTAALGDLPENLLLLLAFSAGGALGGKWITDYKIKSGTLKKDEAAKPEFRNFIADDKDASAWNKLQLFYFTILALAIYFVGLVDELQLAAADSPPSLPNVDATLLMLMGISQGAYLGRKFT